MREPDFILRDVQGRLDALESLRWLRRSFLPPFRYAALAAPDAPLPGDDDPAWRPLEHPGYWGAWRTDFALRGALRVPADWQARGPLALHLPLEVKGDFNHPEALVRVDGEIVAACDRYHHEIVLPEALRDGREHALELRGWSGLGDWQQGGGGTRPFMRACELVEIDPDAHAFLAYARTALDTGRALPRGDATRTRLLAALRAALLRLDSREPLDAERLRAQFCDARAFLERAVADAGPPLDVRVHAAGHAHIDVAWLWTVGQSRRKAARSFSTVLALMERFPEYRFSQSQPQLYRFVEEDEPELFERIRERVREGRWEALGGTWVEPDANCTGAESLARQFLLGRRYFAERFGGADSPVLWLPDTFGFPATLPQIARAAGMTSFATSKLSWNESNRMPHDAFWWEGIDGSRLAAYMLTTPEAVTLVPHKASYNARLTPDQVFDTWHRYHHAGRRDALMVYGHGDGGGGPTPEMLETGRHLADFPGAPQVRFGSMAEFMEIIAAEGDALPVWRGELYLETHRGTLTSQGRTKEQNRRNEALLLAAESAAVAALAVGHPYPQDDLTRAWELLCLNQFHDILPGSSIREVVEESDRDHAEIARLGREALGAALGALAARAPAGSAALALGAAPVRGPRLATAAFLDEGATLALGGTPLPSQPVADGVLIEVPAVPYDVLALERRPAAPAEGDAAVIRAEGEHLILENALLRVTLDAGGEIVSLVDRAPGGVPREREVLAPGARGNRLEFFEDRSPTFDAWDIERGHDDRTFASDVAAPPRIVERGPLRVAAEVQRAYRGSRIVQTIRLARGSRRLEFVTRIDWRERHTLLKAAFPVAVRSARAGFDVQFGRVERPTHRNTSWDAARFEVPAQKWADLSEGDYGVSLLTDTKHGFDVHDATLKVSLVKSATHPDPEADQGAHAFTYALLPHPGSDLGLTVREGYDLERPLHLHPVEGAAGDTADDGTSDATNDGTDDGTNDGGPSLGFAVDHDLPHVVVECVKRAEDGDGVIVRLFENAQARGPATLRFGRPLAGAVRCDLLERDAGDDAGNGDGGLELSPDGRALTLELRPFEIVTLRVRPA